mgnify:FL=1
MKSQLLLLLLSVSTLILGQNNETSIIHEGHYQGKNLYVQNPFSGSGVGFCVIAVYVNGDVTTDQVNSSAFEIDFSNLSLKVGSPVTVKIQHKLDCLPKVLNPEVLRPRSTFETISININEDEVLQWKTSGEQGKLTYIIEQYRWSKWVKAGEVDGSGDPGTHSYDFKISPHSGDNKYRVKQIDYTGKPRISPSTDFSSDIVAISIPNPRVKDKLEFTGETLYEIYDTYGNLVKKGFGQNIGVTNLKKGLYYINYDSKTGEVVNKK